MLKINFVFLLCVVCVVSGWRVFPLPDAPAPTTARAPAPVLNIDFNNRVKPTPVATSPFNKITTTADNIPNKLNIKPTSVKPFLSTQDVSVPANDLLPPKVRFQCYVICP